MGAISTALSDLSHNCVDILPADGLKAKLELAEKEGRPLRVKLGIDPTHPDIHLGHCVVLQKLRQFQDLGHLAVLIIGDYTARVGDPSQRSKTRPMITAEEIEYNAKTYQEQAFRILDPDRVEVRWNGEWLGKMLPEELFKLMSLATLARILERDDFANRFGTNTPISILELIYPLLQAYDSHAIDADIELGGTDQLYNVLMGRDVMPAYGKPPQTVLTLPILVGLDGEQKMSKSLGNYVGVTDEPGDIFGKVMSIPDAAMPVYFRLASGLAPVDAERWVSDIGSEDVHPNAAKRALAQLIVKRLYDDEAAVNAEARFDTMFKSHGVPDDTPTVSITTEDHNTAGRIFLPAFMVRHLGIPSNGEARRLVQQGGVKLDGDVIGVDSLELDPSILQGKVLQVGKRKFVRIATPS